MNKKNNILVYQAKSGAIELRGDYRRDTIWGNLNQIADLFGVQKPAISKHLKNIYKEGELEKKATVSKMETVQNEGKRTVTRNLEYYNLDVIISVGYRVNSKKATEFRRWATKILKEYITKGYSINRKQVLNNYDKFIKSAELIKKLARDNKLIGNDDLVDLIKAFADTWISLDAYDKSDLPKTGKKKKKVVFMAEELQEAVAKLKKDLMKKKEATDLFAQEKKKGSFEGTVGNIFQSFDNKDVYLTIEEKAAHLLYFVVKNHVFNDGNKRSGAFSFVWFLQKAGMLNQEKMTPTALTPLTLLIAESDPKDKEKMIGLVLLLLKK